MRTLVARARGLKPARARGMVLPRLWLVSDPVRLPDPRAAAARLPREAGVLARGAPAAAVAALRRVGRMVLVGADGRAALRQRAGLHVPDRRGCAGLLPFLLARRGRARWALLSVAVHGRAGIARGRRLRADLAFVSPAFATASHPGAPGLGPHRWARLARAAGRAAVALGGVAARRAGRLPRAAGLAAIDGLTTTDM